MLNGLKRGLQMIADALSMRYRAQLAGNTGAVLAIDAVFSTWFSEVTGTALGVRNVDVRIAMGNLLFGDPFQGSREQFRAVKVTYPTV